MKKGRPINQAIKIAINELVKKGYNYKDIAEMLKIKSRQLVAYHFKSFRGTAKKS